MLGVTGWGLGVRGWGLWVGQVTGWGFGVWGYGWGSVLGVWGYGLGVWGWVLVLEFRIRTAKMTPSQESQVGLSLLLSITVYHSLSRWHS